MVLNGLLRNSLFDALLAPEARVARRHEMAARREGDPGPTRAVEEGMAWLGRAQDHSSSRDGGVARHYSLLDGWAASYPETTGYIVPTMLAHADSCGDRSIRGRARRMLDWLVAIQFPDGGYQGGMVDQSPRVPVTFNTGQILMGLAAGTLMDDRYHEPMLRAADWLVSTQDEDGCWRKHPTPFAVAGEKVYETHVAWGLLQADAVAPGRGYLSAALRQVDWAIALQTPNGWYPNCCLSVPDRPLTHTIGYALRGIVEAYRASSAERYLIAASRTADALLGCISSDGRLPGRLDRNWDPAAKWVCLTGTAQIAHCWLLLYRITGRADYLDAGRRANAYIRRRILVSGPEATRGAVPGSDPVGGEYGTWQFLNWATKFSIDANTEEMLLVAGS
ncbi:MAG: hypothetical protein AB7I59_00525 [Geminicoccaceae bacterium]